ncbi:succinylglutamate desuccinylase/aspartoacylase family protein [Bacteriovoracaceae bacterium]|nr:succinylglutamate desuccinylase/aspartoacylase family protein [Bacteriovoracaceae bacterium]
MTKNDNIKSKFDKTRIPIKDLASGDKLHLNLFRLTGDAPGPHIHIQSSVHGAELQGNAVIFELLKYFKEHSFYGTITFIPVANPQATTTKIGTATLGRFNSVTGNNFNRNYVDIIKESNFDIEKFLDENAELSWSDLKKTYKQTIFTLLKEYQGHQSVRGLCENKKLNLVLQKLASSADIVLDLHTGPVATRYLYSANYQKNSAKYFLFPHTLLIPNEFAGAMDEACFCPWVYLHQALEKRDINHPRDVEAYTVELGSEEKISTIEAHEDARRILHYLCSKNVISERPDISHGDQFYCDLDQYKTYYLPHGGLVEYLRGPGERFRAGEELYRILNLSKLESLEELEDCTHTVTAMSDGIVINHSPACSLGEGAEVMQVMESPLPY